VSPQAHPKGSAMREGGAGGLGDAAPVVGVHGREDGQKDLPRERGGLIVEVQDRLLNEVPAPPVGFEGPQDL